VDDSTRIDVVPSAQGGRGVERCDASAASGGLRVWQELGLTYPPTDWNETWLTVRAKATEAIMDLRDLVERLPAGGCTEHTG
jgi:hypothetical protein